MGYPPSPGSRLSLHPALRSYGWSLGPSIPRLIGPPAPPRRPRKEGRSSTLIGASYPIDQLSNAGACPNPANVGTPVKAGTTDGCGSKRVEAPYSFSRWCFTPKPGGGCSTDGGRIRHGSATY